MDESWQLLKRSISTADRWGSVNAPWWTRHSAEFEPREYNCSGEDKAAERQSHLISQDFNVSISFRLSPLL